MSPRSNAQRWPAGPANGRSGRLVVGSSRQAVPAEPTRGRPNRLGSAGRTAWARPVRTRRSRRNRPAAAAPTGRLRLGRRGPLGEGDSERACIAGFQVLGGQLGQRGGTIGEVVVY